MDNTDIKASSRFVFLRSCKEETNESIDGELKGEIPAWLEGNLIRIGSGLLKVGSDHYNHVFDGLALMHQFIFKNSKVTYRNKFLRSDTYRKNMKANRIIVNEFATPGAPDPCKTIFQRFFSLFNLDEMTDNDLVNVVLYSNEAYACSETNFIWRVNPNTLESIEKVKLNNFLPVNGAIAHPHEDKDGTVYNIGSTFSIRPNYKIIRVPPKTNKMENTFQNSSVICSIPSSKLFTIGYHHSFAMSENYFVVVEQPLYMSILKILKAHFFSGAYSDALYWDENHPARFHVICRSDGKRLNTIYSAKSFFVFHHINAYEEDNNLIVDMCTYDKGEMVKAMYVQALEDKFRNNEPFYYDSCAKRYVLPLLIDDKNGDKNLVKLPDSQAKAHKLEDGSIFCTPEILTETDWKPELPRINYKMSNGKKYKYFYAMAIKGKQDKVYLIKCDVQTKITLIWNEEGAIPSEPVFVQEPNIEIKDEDSGVLLASLLYTNDETKVSILVLNAKTMQEIGRVSFHTKSSVPGDFHGTFISNN